MKGRITQSRFSDLEGLDKRRILEIHKNSFSSCGSENYSRLLNLFMEGTNTGDLLLFSSNGQILGFQMNRLISKSDELKEYIDSKLYYSQNPQEKDYLLKYYQRFADRIKPGSRASVSYFDNIFTNPSFERGLNDIYVDVISVSPEFHGRGIGSQLLLKTIELAKQNSSIFADCIEESNSRKLFEGSGFLPFLFVSPVDYDGRGSVSVGFKKD